MTSRLFSNFWICVVLIVAFATASPARAQNVTVNFNQAEIQAVIDDVSVVTGYAFIVDPSVRGRVTITSQTPLTPDEYFQVFLSTLRVHGFTAIPTASGAYQIVPDQVGARAGGPVNSQIRGDQYVTEVVRLDHASVRDALTVLRPIIHPQGSINAAESSNVLVIVDFAENMQRIRQIIADLDRDTSVFEMVELENVSAVEMSRIVQTLRSRTSSGEDDTMSGVSIAPLPGSNALLLRGNAPSVREMISLVRRVDAVSVSNQTYRVVALDHADGAHLLPILQSMIDTLDAATDSARPASVSYHNPTNSLVINASSDIQREIDRVVRQLDVRRPQVLVEGIIVEISDSAAQELGVQLLLAGGDNTTTPLGLTRFSAPTPDLLSIIGAVSTDDDQTDISDALRAAALNSLLAASGGTIGFGGQSNDGTLFGLVLNAVENDTDSNVLSTPSILAMDNEEASFLSGQEIPITTGETLGADNSNPFRTIERQEVGVMLTVRPQITEGGTVRLHIQQEVSSIADLVSSNSTDLITNKRSVETTVLADNGEIIILGGLIEQNDRTTRNGVPGLSRIPGVGRLFRSDGQTSTRTNLMIFIRPTIIRSEADMRAVSEGRYNYMSNTQRAASPTGTSSLESLVEMMMATTDTENPGD